MRRSSGLGISTLAESGRDAALAMDFEAGKSASGLANDADSAAGGFFGLGSNSGADEGSGGGRSASGLEKEAESGRSASGLENDSADGNHEWSYRKGPLYGSMRSTQYGQASKEKNMMDAAKSRNILGNANHT